MIQTFSMFVLVLHLLLSSLTAFSPLRSLAAYPSHNSSPRRNAYPWPWLRSARPITTTQEGSKITETVDCRLFWNSLSPDRQAKLKTSTDFLRALVLHRHEPLPLAKNRSVVPSYRWPWITALQVQGSQIDGRVAWDVLSHRQRRETRTFRAFLETVRP